MRPIYVGALAAGPAVTVSLPPGDNLMIHVAVEVCQPGDILVVVPTSYCTDGYFGELLATSLRSRGVRGLIIEAGCRDIRALTEMKFPVWSRAIGSQGTVKATLGSVNIPVVCAGAAICPGDVIVGDDDGVVVVKRELAPEVVQLSEQRIKKEALTRERLAKGESGLDVYGWRQKVAALGLEYK
jgi:4-hydroxy-4-methyl-2-oxoglutarate aldolase